MAIRMLGDKATSSVMLSAINGNENLQSDSGAYMTAKKNGDDSLLDKYEDGAYDSSADFWKLMEDGSLAYDGDGWLKDSNGNYILDDNRDKIGSSTPEKGLANILGITTDEAHKLMKDSGFIEKDGYWHIDAATNAINKTKSISLENEIYEDKYYSKLYGYNPINIYSNLVKQGEMDIDWNNYIAGSQDNQFFENDPSRFISYDEYKANNFISGSPSYQTLDTFSEFDVTTLIGARGTLTENPHRGTDAATPKGTDALQLLFNNTSTVAYSSKGKTEDDKNSPQGLYVTTSTTITYKFKGEERKDTIYYRIMHLSEATVDEGGQLAWDTVLGKTGNTGQLPTIKTYPYHAHEDIYTAGIPSPFLDYLTGSTSNAAQRLYYKPDDRFFYDKFIFANKNNYTIRAGADTYN
jgi:hypothetical protein